MNMQRQDATRDSSMWKSDRLGGYSGDQVMLSAQKGEGSQVEGAEGRWSGGRVKRATDDKDDGGKADVRSRGTKDGVLGRSRRGQRAWVQWAGGSGYGLVVVREQGWPGTVNS